MNRHTLSIFLFYVMFFLQACDNTAVSETQTNSEQQPIKGHYIYGHETNTFQPCEQHKVYWVNGSNQILNRLKNKYESFKLQPYEKVFVELTGEFSDKSLDGFAMDYDGQFLVSTLLSMDKKTNDDCR